MTTKICIHCIHHQLQVHDYLCGRTEQDIVNPVTGDTLHLHARPCSFERSGQGGCGPSGLHWSPLPGFELPVEPAKAPATLDDPTPSDLAA